MRTVWERLMWRAPSGRLLRWNLAGEGGAATALPTIDWVTKRRAPTAAAAASRLALPTVRRALVLAMSRWRAGGFLSAVSWWITASAARPWTAASRAPRSKASATTGAAPSPVSSRRLAGSRVSPCTRWPRATSARTSGTPIVPVAPAAKTLILSAVFHRSGTGHSTPP
jgi:hypothetical protein